MKPVLLLWVLFLTTIAFPQTRKLPIIDMHLHAYPADYNGVPPSVICGPFANWSVRDPRDSAQKYLNDVIFKNTNCCGTSFSSPKTDDALMYKTFNVLKKYNIYAVTSGPFKYVEKWKKANPERIISGIEFSPTMNIPVDTFRKWITQNRLKVMGELVGQYDGITLSDPVMEPYLALAEEFDVPVSVHVGPGPPGIAYAGSPNYRAKFHSALVIEEALLKHPHLRVIVAHAGWPMIDDMIAMLYVHPQVYVDLGILCYAYPKKDFYYYLQRLVDSGFEKRICFGSDQMIWPQAIVTGIETINKATFLSAKQKRDIFYNNAARFLRLDKTQLVKVQ